MLGPQFKNITQVGIATEYPEGFPQHTGPLFSEDFQKVAERGTEPLDLSKTKFFSVTQQELHPDTVEAYRKAGSERKSDVFDEHEDSHLEYPHVVLHNDTAEIIDGHHRIAAALADKRQNIRAYITRSGQ